MVLPPSGKFFQRIRFDQLEFDCVAGVVEAYTERKVMKWIPSLTSLFLLPGLSLGQELATERRIGRIETVATFEGPMPTGGTVSNEGRVFVNFPKWGDNVQYTVAEVKNRKTLPYPNADINAYHNGSPQADKLVSVHSVVVDPTGNRLWILDTGSIGFGPVKPGGPKLIAVDLATNKIIKKIVFPSDVALSTSYLNDVRFDLRRGTQGMAFITDSTSSGSNGIVVVDLASGKSWRRLHEHAYTKPYPQFFPIVEGEVMQLWLPGQSPMRFAVGSDGIAISPDGQTLYYFPLTSRHLYSVSVDALADQSQTEAGVAATVKDLGEKGGASDGLESDAQGRVYLSAYEYDAIRRRTLDGKIDTLVHDPRVLWPDTLSLAADGYLYFKSSRAPALIS